MIKNKKVYADLNNLCVRIDNGTITTNDKYNSLQGFDKSYLKDLENLKLLIGGGVVNLIFKNPDFNFKEILRYKIKSKKSDLVIEYADKNYGFIVAPFIEKLHEYLKNKSRELHETSIELKLREIVEYFINKTYEVENINCIKTAHNIKVYGETVCGNTFDFIFNLLLQNVSVDLDLGKSLTDFNEMVDIAVGKKIEIETSY